MFNQSDAARLLFEDFQAVTSHLCIREYAPVFEEELQEYFPFNEAIMTWLQELYGSEKYENLKPLQRSLEFEENHPFLFIRDLAHMNNWNAGFDSEQRLNHIAGLMFSGQPLYALEATLCLCRPSRLGKPVGQWFDFKQAMNNLEIEVAPSLWAEDAGEIENQNLEMKAWKAGALFFLYFHLSESDQVKREELFDLIEPYREAIEKGLESENLTLKEETTLLYKTMQQVPQTTFADGMPK